MMDQRPWLRRVDLLGRIALVAGALGPLSSQTLLTPRSAWTPWSALIPTGWLALLAVGVLATGIAAILERRWRSLQPTALSLGLVILFLVQRTTPREVVSTWVILAVTGLILAVLGDQARRQVVTEIPGRAALMIGTALLLIGGALRLYGLASHPPRWLFDEALNTNFSLEFHTGRAFEATVQAKEFLFYFLGAGWMHIAGTSVLAMRRLSGLIGILCLPAIYGLGARLHGRAAGLGAMLLLTLSPWHLAASRVAARQGLALLAIPVALVLWWDGLERARTGRLAAAGLVTGLGFHTWIPFKPLPALLLLMIGRALIRSRDRRGRLLVGLVLAGVLFATVLLGPCALDRRGFSVVRFVVFGEIGESKVLKEPGQLRQNALAMTQALLGHPTAQDSYYRSEYGPESALTIALALAGLALCLKGVRAWPRLLTLVLLGAMGLPPLLSSFPFQRRMQGLMIPIVLLGGLALSRWLSPETGRNRLSWIPMLVGAALLLRAGGSILPAGLAAVPGEADRLYRSAQQRMVTDTVFLEEGRFQRDWRPISSWETTGGPFAYWTGPLPESLPLTMRDDRDAWLFFRLDRADEILPRIRQLYPQAEEELLRDHRDLPAGWQVRIPAEGLAPARQQGLDHPERFHRLNLEPFSLPWGDGRVWGRDPEALYYKNRDNLRLNDLASGPLVVEGIPFELLPHRGAMLRCERSPAPEGMVDRIRWELPEPLRLDRVHLLGMTSPWIDHTDRGAARLILERQGGEPQVEILRVRPWELRGRKIPRPGLASRLAVRQRGTYLDLASFEVEPGPPVTAVEILDSNPAESLLLMAATLQLLAREAEDVVPSEP